MLDERPWLTALAVLGFIVVLSGTFLFCYPSTLGMIRRASILTHDITGDLCLVVAAVYLFPHLRRVWRRKRLRASRISGYVVVALFLIVGGTGIYGQIAVLEAGTLAYWSHLGLGVLLTLLACGHGAWGFRRRLLAKERRDARHPSLEHAKDV